MKLGIIFLLNQIRASRTANLTEYIYLLEVITDQCSAFDLAKEIEVLAAGMELDFFH